MLDKEKGVFESHRADLLKRARGKYALVVGEDLVDVFDHREEAYAAGVERFGNVPMLIKRVQESDDVDVLPALTLGLLRVHRWRRVQTGRARSVGPAECCPSVSRPTGSCPSRVAHGACQEAPREWNANTIADQWSRAGGYWSKC